MIQRSANPESLRAKQKRQRQEAIIAAGRQVFMIKGRDAATIDEIAALAGVSSLTVFNYFGDKDALFLAVWTGLRREAHIQIRELVNIAAETSPLRLIETYLIQLMRISVGNEHREMERRLWCDFYAAHYASAGKASDDLVRQEDDMILADLQHILQYCINRGSCRPTASTLDIAEGILAIGNLHWMRWLTSEDGDNDLHMTSQLRAHRTLRQVRLFVEPLLCLTEPQQGKTEK